MKTNRHAIVAGIVCGVLLTLAPFAGIIGTILGLRREFQELGHAGIGDPSMVSGTAGGTLIPTLIGVLLCPIGIALFVACLKSYRRLPHAAPSATPAS